MNRNWIQTHCCIRFRNMGCFKTNCAACKKDSVFSFENIYKNNIADKSQIRYLNYISGVNKHSSNLANLSETGHFPMYVYIILSIVQYLYRLENLNDGLLKQAYELAKDLHGRGIQPGILQRYIFLVYLTLTVLLVGI